MDNPPVEGTDLGTTPGVDASAPVPLTTETKKLIDQSNQDRVEMLKMLGEIKEQAAATRGEVKSYAEMSGEHKEKIKRVTDAVADLEIRLKTLARLQPSASPSEFADDPRMTPDYQKSIDAWLRQGDAKLQGTEGGLKMWRTVKLHNLGDPSRFKLAKAPETKALATDYTPGAGVFARPTMEREITRRVIEMSPLRAYATVKNISGPYYEGILRTRNRDAVNRVGERSSRGTKTETKRYQPRRVFPHELHQQPGLSQTSIEDSGLDLERELIDDSAIDFALDEADMFVNGSGVDEAFGLLYSERVEAIETLQVMKLQWEDLIYLYTSLAGPYRANGMFGVSREALREIMLMRTDSGAGTGTGNFLWSPTSPVDGSPSKIHNSPWWEDVHFPGVVANATPVVYGDIRQTYRIVDRRGLRIVRDEVTETPIVILKMTRRVGGDVWKGEACKKLRIKQSGG